MNKKWLLHDHHTTTYQVLLLPNKKSKHLSRITSRRFQEWHWEPQQGQHEALDQDQYQGHYQNKDKRWHQEWQPQQ